MNATIKITVAAVLLLSLGACAQHYGRYGYYGQGNTPYYSYGQSSGYYEGYGKPHKRHKHKHRHYSESRDRGNDEGHRGWNAGRRQWLSQNQYGNGYYGQTPHGNNGRRGRHGDD